jgi:hypothetical protein
MRETVADLVAPKEKTVFADYDDLTLVSNDLTRNGGVTLISIVRNEMYMLPAFLEHYRALGVERFIILDDRSDDGTREFLFRQPDVMVVGSSARYGEVLSPDGRMPFPDMRSNIVWRNVLIWKYGFGQWTMMLDADEFLVLPSGMKIQDVVAQASEQEQRAVMGIMLDVYPRKIADLKDDSVLQPQSGWFFDGQPHLRMREGGNPAVVYPGARARLMVKYGLRKADLRLRVRNIVRKPWYPGFNLNSKVILHRWGDSDLFLNAHKTTAQVNDRILLPIKHYKFNADLYRKVEVALSEKRYAGGSVEYRSLSDLLERMKTRDGSFLYRYSRDAGSFEAFAETGNAIL